MTQHVADSQVLTCQTCHCDHIKLCSVTISTCSVTSPQQAFMIVADYLCEGCPGGTLTIQFHKGQTLVERGYV